MILANRKGQLFELVEEVPYDELKVGSIILVRTYGLSEIRAEFFQPIIKKYHKGNLTPVENAQFLNPNHYFEKEDAMASSVTLVKLATEKGAKGVEIAIRERMKKLVARAHRLAENENAFVAVVELDKVLKTFGVENKAPTLAPKESVEMKLTKTDKVDGAIWSAILGKVEKIGDIVKAEKNSAVIRLKKAEAKKFQDATQAIDGVTISQ